MKKQGILHPMLNSVISELGHYDMLGIVDAGFPIPFDVERVDLQIVPNLPRFIPVLEAIASEVEVEKVIIASETQSANPNIFSKAVDILRGAELEIISHEEFKQRSKSARAIVKTGEFSPFANIILVSGVPY